MDTLHLCNFLRSTEMHALEDLLMALVEAKAEQSDNEINTSLLKDLVLKYALAERELAELNRLKNKFLGIAAHDLRNPLSSIRGFAELLLDEDTELSEEEQKEFLTMIHGISASALDLVNDLLDVSTIESGKFDLAIIRGSLVPTLEERMRINTIIAEKKGIKIHASLTEVSDVLFDPKRISQVIDNLVGNAIKFSPSNSNVHISMREEERWVHLSVRDEGPGISPEDQLRLFGEFQKLSAKPTGGEQSTGLGLAIVKKIVEEHGGAIHVESRINCGSTFSFTLPRGERRKG